MDQSAMSREEAMQSMYGKTYDRNPVGLKQGLYELGMMIAMPALMFGAPLKAVQLGRLVTGTRAYKAFGFVKRPVLTMAVNAEIRGARAAMAVSKTYGRAIFTLGALDFKRNVQLARQREWKRLGINIYGPPGSLWFYDNHLAETSETNKMMKDASAAKSRIDSSLTSKSKTRGKRSNRLPNKLYSDWYIPMSGQKCKPGYYRVGHMCVKD